MQAYQQGDTSVLGKLSDDALKALNAFKVTPALPQADKKAMAKEAALEGAIGTLGMLPDLSQGLAAPIESAVSAGVRKLGFSPSEPPPMAERPLTSAWLTSKAKDFNLLGKPEATPLTEADKRYYEMVKGAGAAAPIMAPVAAGVALAGAPVAGLAALGGGLAAGAAGGWLGEDMAQTHPASPELARLGGNLAGGLAAQSGVNAATSAGRGLLGGAAIKAGNALGYPGLVRAGESMRPPVNASMARYDTEGVSPMSLGDVSGKSWLQQLQRVTGEGLGGSGVSHNAAERYGATFEQALARRASQAGLAGGAPEASEAGTSLQRGLREWRDLMIGSGRQDANGVPILSKYEELMADVYRKVPASTPVDSSASAMVLADKVGTLPGLPPYLRGAYSSWVQGKPVPFEELKELRNHVGDIARSAERTGTGGLAAGTVGSRYYNQVYRALGNDMEAGLVKAGGPDAADAWRSANQHYAKTMSTIEDSLGSIAGAKTPEEAFAAAQRGIFNPKGGATNLQTLKSAMLEAGEPGKGAWDTLVGKTVADLGKAAPADPASFSINTFFKNYSSLNDDAKNVMFAGPGKGDLRKGLDNLAAIAGEAKVGNRFYNTSKTAASNQIMKLMDKLPEMAGSLAIGGGIAMETGSAAAIPAVIGGNWALQKLLTSPTFIRWASSVPSPEAIPRSLSALVASSAGLPTDERGAIETFARTGGFTPKKP